MNLFPKASGMRPRVACEITSQGVVAGRSAEPAAPLAAVAKADLRNDAVVPGLKPGNIADRVAVIAAVRKVMESVGMRGNARGANLTLVIPDAAVRVLLLEFESLPNKLSEALPLVRFRLKKLLPFEADDAMVTFQIMSHSKSLVRVLAVAIPRDVLAEYETAVREAGFEPGAVLPSTLAALAGIGEAGSGDTGPATLLVNANRLGITTAIVRDGLLLLHRSVDLQEHGPITPANVPAALFGGAEAHPNVFATLPLVSVDETEAEWAAQQALPEHGRNPYADRAQDEEAVQNEDGITALPVPAVFPTNGNHGMYASRPAPQAGEPGALGHSPYAATTVAADLMAESHNAEFYAPTSPGTLTEDQSGLLPPLRERESLREEPSPLEHAMPAHTNGYAAERVQRLQGTRGEVSDGHQQDLAEAVSVAAAYFEDTLSTAPRRVWSAGPLGADALRRALQVTGVGGENGLEVRELVEPAALLSDAVTASVPRGWLSGVVGALRS